jgi:hypothetical protein
MKNYYLSMLLTFSFFSLNSQIISWNPPVSVANGGTYNNIYPRLTLTDNDVPLVSWMNGNNNKIYTARWNGTSFNMPVTINPSGVIPFITNWAGSEIASSGDTVFVTFSTDFSQTSKVYTVRSLDGGVTFQDTVRVDQIGTDTPRFPTVAVGSGGNPVIAFMQLDISFGNAEYAVARSMNGGTSFMPSIIPSSGAVGTVCDCCPATIITNGDQHVLTYRNNDNNIRNMWASYSTDGSMNYNISSEIDETDWMIMSCPSSGPSNVIIGDSLVSTWMSDSKVYLGTTNLANQQNGIQRQLFPADMSTQNYPIIAGKGDTLAIVWQGYDTGTPKLFFTSSVTGTSGLGIVIDTITATFSGNQTRPDLEYSNGKFHIVYSDNNGNDVKYLSGMIEESVGLEENEKPSISIFVTQLDGTPSLHIQSQIDQNVSVTMVNSLGKILLENDAFLKVGESSIELPYRISKGMCFILITSETGEKVIQKVILNN